MNKILLAICAVVLLGASFWCGRVLAPVPKPEQIIAMAQQIEKINGDTGVHFKKTTPIHVEFDGPSLDESSTNIMARALSTSESGATETLVRSGLFGKSWGIGDWLHNLWGNIETYAIWIGIILAALFILAAIPQTSAIFAPITKIITTLFTAAIPFVGSLVTWLGSLVHINATGEMTAGLQKVKTDLLAQTTPLTGAQSWQIVQTDLNISASPATQKLLKL